jgi:UDP-N-acetylmuramate--alanine ligase
VIAFNDIKKLYFIGIGGIGMSALARYFKNKGCQVSGYDKTSTPLTQQLAVEGITICYEEVVHALPTDVQLVIYTPAIPTDNEVLQYYLQKGFWLQKRSEVLQLITNGGFNICVAGTHGKTTISTLVAHILQQSGYGCNAFLGGISANYQTNFWGNKQSNTWVIEADEYDRSFLKLQPSIAIISAIDADHLEVYGTIENLEDAFVQFSRLVPPNGLLLTKCGLSQQALLCAEKKLTYSLQDTNANAYTKNIKATTAGYQFDAVLQNATIAQLRWQMGGLHNIENAMAAIAVAHYLGIEAEKIKNAISSFKGVKRRFEYVIAATDDRPTVFIDDYAHHPEELRALISSAKHLFANKKCTLVFQPHLYSRTKDLATAFANSLDLADEVVLMPIYPARELPIEGVSSEMIKAQMKNKNVEMVSKDALLEWLEKNHRTIEVLITAGAGDIDTFVTPIKAILESK